MGLKPGTRTGLWEHFAYAIAALRPKLVVIENVLGLLSADAVCDVESCPFCLGDSTDGVMRALGAVLADLASLGFDAEWTSIRASDAGAPHRRDRIFVVATDSARTGGFGDLPGVRGSGARVDMREMPEGQQSGVEDWGLPTPTVSDTRQGTYLRKTTIEAAERGKRSGIGLTHLVEGDLPEFVVLPTPRALEPGSTSDGYGMSLNEAARLLSTPTAGLGEGGGQRSHRWKDAESRRSHNPVELAADRAMLPTPTTQDGANTGEFGDSQQKRQSKALNALAAEVSLMGTHAASHNVRSDSFRKGSDTPAELVAGFGQGFGPYQAAISRWEQILGRPAPSPVQQIAGSDKQRLNPEFVEWMMGLPEGHVTGVDISRNAQLKALGNGVVPQQAALALRILLPRLFDQDSE